MKRNRLEQEMIAAMGKQIGTYISLMLSFAEEEEKHTLQGDIESAMSNWHLSEDFKHKAEALCDLAIDCGIADRLVFRAKSEDTARQMIAQLQETREKIEREMNHVQ